MILNQIANSNEESKITGDVFTKMLSLGRSQSNIDSGRYKKFSAIDPIKKKEILDKLRIGMSEEQMKCIEDTYFNQIEQEALSQ